MWYDRFGTAVVSVADIATAAFKDPTLAFYNAMCSEVPKMRRDPSYAHLSRWLTAIDGQIVQTPRGPHQITHVGRKWRLAPVQEEAEAASLDAFTIE